MAHIGDWEAIIAITDDADQATDRLQFRSVRVLLLCASATALAHLGELGKAQAKLSTAIRVCPRGAVEAQIALGTATGTCLTLAGEISKGEAYFDRALSAARAIGHRLQEQRIVRERKVSRLSSGSEHSREAPGPTQESNNSDTTLVLADVATILDASSSVDLLAHRTTSLIQGTSLGSRLRIHSLSDQDFRPEISVESSATVKGGFEIQLRGSDRLITFEFDSIDSLDDITLVRSLSDLLRAAAHQDARLAVASIDQDLWPETTAPGDGEAIFRSPRMNEILRVAIRLAATDLPILITGETGTGKDVFARLVHSHSTVKSGPFVPFNCSAIPKDLIEIIQSAAGGTLFLDEIGDLELGLQPKLLRFIESGEIHTLGNPRPRNVKVRLIAATNADLEQRAASGLFRSDLLFRLGTARIILPPLRDRKDEIPALTASFINRFSRESGRPRLRVSDDLIAALLLYDWPGNIRQLSHELHRIVAVAEPGQTLTSADLSPAITEGWTLAPKTYGGPSQSVQINVDQPLPKAIEELERGFVDRAMHASGGRVAEAAQLLGISRKGLFLKRRRWGHLDPEPPDDDE
jgi:DNA-binding NtrC family response regulator